MKENLFTPNCIRTFTGKYVNGFNPDPDTICIEDIAHGLSNAGRFAGQLPRFYSVAQHSIECAKMVSDKEDALCALMHDASEAYLNDVARPWKKKMPDYLRIEDNLMRVIAAKFGFDWPIPLRIKMIDDQQLHFEWYNLMIGSKPFSFRIMSHRRAEKNFLKQFKLLNP